MAVHPPYQNQSRARLPVVLWTLFHQRTDIPCRCLRELRLAISQRKRVRVRQAIDRRICPYRFAKPPCPRKIRALAARQIRMGNRNRSYTTEDNPPQKTISSFDDPPNDFDSPLAGQ